MSLLTPLALLWLGISIPVIAMYFLKLKRKKRPVSSTWLWVKSIQDLRVNAPFQRLRRNLLLILQLLLVLFAALALTDPVGLTDPPENKRWVLLVDRSASMSLKDVAPSRLEAAKEVARRIVNDSSSRDEMMVIAFSNRAQVMTPFTRLKSDVARAIDRIEPSDSVTRIEEAFRIALSAVQGAKSREIVILSDGHFEPLQNVPADLDIRYAAIGAEPRNAAISSLDVKRPAGENEAWTVFAQIDLFHKEALEFPVELYVNGRLRGVKKVAMEGNTNVAALFEVSKVEPEVVEVKIALEDDLDADNHAWFVVKRDPSKILLVTAGNFFLEKAIANVKDAEPYKVDDLSKASVGDYEAVILDGRIPDTPPEGRYLILGGVPKWEGLKGGDPIATPPVVDWSRRHPATRNINFGGIYVKSAPRVELPGFGTPLVESVDTPLIFSWERNRTRALVVTFNPLESDWPLRVSFPLFIANALQWLREEGQVRLQPGDPLRIRLEEGEEKVEIATPGGARHTLAGTPGEEVVLGDTERRGLYVVQRKDRADGVAINLLDPRESSGKVQKEIQLTSSKVVAAGVAIPVTRPYWRWLALAALALLLIEWLVYHRRVDF